MDESLILGFSAITEQLVDKLSAVGARVDARLADNERTLRAEKHRDRAMLARFVRDMSPEQFRALTADRDELADWLETGRMTGRGGVDLEAKPDELDAELEAHAVKNEAKDSPKPAPTREDGRTIADWRARREAERRP